MEVKSAKLMELIDTHCHLTAVEKEKLPAIFERAKECSVKRFVCIGASDGIISAHDAVELSKQYPEVFCSVGVHPHDAGQHQDLKEIERLFEEEKVVAVGETGLDFFRDWAPVEDQRKLFRYSIELAKDIGKPLIIHCREAADETIATLKELSADKIGGVFHCYAEDGEFAKKIADLNFLVSFTGNITFKKALDRRKAVAEIPLEQIMLETDMPYMAPEPFRGKPSEPMHVYKVAQMIAEVKEVSLQEVAEKTSKTAVSFFGLSN